MEYDKEYSYHAAKRYKCFEEAVSHMRPWGSKQFWS